MFRDPLFIAVAVACLVVTAILLMGIGNFAKSGDPKRSNQLMKWRIIAQFVAVAFLLLFVTIRRGG